MEPACIRHTDLPGTSRLFADICYHFDRVKHFYAYDPHDPESFDLAAQKVDYPAERRAAMVTALRAQNGPSPLLERFAKDGTVAVVTGQQVGLFSGPCYTIYKALTAIRLADRLNERGVPAVPIFWLATEDHDFPEVAHAWVYDGERQPVRLDVHEPAALAGRPHPVGGVPVQEPPLAALRQALASLPFAEDVVAAVEQAYAPGATMGSSFRQLLISLLGKIGILTLDPLDPAVRAIGAPFIVKALEAVPDLKADLLERNRELSGAGYHAQVHIEPKTSLFFLLQNGERSQLRHKDSEFAQLKDRAADISPNALLRPVWQDYLLPTAAYVGGPAELAYFAQSRTLYDQLLGRVPVVFPRFGFTLLDSRAEKLLQRFHLGVTDTLVHQEALHERIAKALIPPGLSRSFDETSADFSERIDRLALQVEEFDRTLAAALEKSRAKILHQVDKSRRKIERESLLRNHRASADARYLGGLLYPHRHLQERFYTILPFMAQHGMDLAERLYPLIELDCPDHRVVTL